jgi:ribosome-binding ATPase
MRIGIVGLPNAGKSSLFNALTGSAAQTANYPFTTIEPNVAVVPVADPRLDRVAEVVGASEVAPDTIEFYDVAGLVADAHRGEGLGNRFLGHIRETDAIAHVVRCHGDERVVHPEGRVDPLADVATVETELVYADLEQVERRLERVARQARGGVRQAAKEERWLEEVAEALRAGRPARAAPAAPEAAAAVRQLALLSAKPVLFVANVEDGEDDVPPQLAAHADRVGAAAVAVCARLEAELAELGAEEAAAMREELGLPDGGVQRVVRAAFELLDLIAFFTADPGRPAMSRHMRRGMTAWDAAGMVHTDMQRGFVRAEVVTWHELVEAGGFAGARERGTLRVEGRDYPVADGEVVHVRFTPP